MDTITFKNFNGLTIDNMTFSQAFSYSPNISELTKMYVNPPLYNQTNRESLEAILIIPTYCYFNKEDCYNLMETYFLQYFSYDYGDCYQFNVGLNYSNQLVPYLKQTGEGSDFGLIIQFGPYVSFNKYYTAQPCLNLTQLDCIQRVSSAFEQKKCTSECPLECDSVKYEYSLSGMTFPSQIFYDKLKGDVNYLNSTESSFYGIDLSSIENYRKYFLMINVFCPYLEYTEITESPKFTLIDLISQAGGSLGMFCSFSLFHFIEIVEILIITFYIML
jgi:hypothetical protein